MRHAGTTELIAALDASAAAVEGDGDGDTVRVWHGGAAGPLVLDTLTVKERFGEFAFRLVLDQREVVVERAWIEANIVDERMPVIGTVRCHRLIMDDLRAAVDDLIAAGHEDWLSPRRYAGCFYPRRIGFGRENLSRHTWGIAIDLNVDFSLPGAGPVAPRRGRRHHGSARLPLGRRLLDAGQPPLRVGREHRRAATRPHGREDATAEGPAA